MDFLKSLIFPLKMRRFRNMSVIIAIAIFLLSTYFAIVPIQVKYRKSDIAISQNQYLSKNFCDATTNFDYEQIKVNNYKIENQSLSADTEECIKYTVLSNIDNKDYTFYLVFDMTKDSYNQEDDLYANYELEKSNDSCVLLFSKSYYELQKVKEEDSTLKAEIVQAATYKGCNIDFPSYTTTEEMMDGIGNTLGELYSSMFISSFTITGVLMIFLLPLLVILVMWLILRKNGSLKRFKEYYNIAAIASIIPTLITFGVAWLWPQIVNFYTTGFVMYYLFVIYRINAFPIDYSPELEKNNN